MISMPSIRSFVRDDRAVSISVGFILTFTITFVTMIVLVSSFHSMMDSAEHTVMRNEFEIHGNEISLQISNIDTAISITNSMGGRVDDMSYQLKLPDTIANKQYSVEFSDNPKEIIFEADGREETRIKVSYTTQELSLKPAKLYSGSNKFLMIYNSTSKMIEIH